MSLIDNCKQGTILIRGTILNKKFCTVFKISKTDFLVILRAKKFCWRKQVYPLVISNLPYNWLNILKVLKQKKSFDTK